MKATEKIGGKVTEMKAPTERGNAESGNRTSPTKFTMIKTEHKNKTVKFVAVPRNDGERNSYE